MSSKKFPKDLFVKREFENNGKDSWLTTSESVNNLAVLNESVQVAVYKLVRVVKLKTEVLVRP